MIKIAVVEDEQPEATLLKEHIERFERESGERCEVDVFSDGIKFLDGYDHSYDVVFMDIAMPDINGMQASHKLRTIDETVPIVFVTNMKQFAIEGYEVAALDFILKPANFYRVSAVLKKIVKSASERSAQKVVRTDGGMVKVKLDGVYYVEITGRDIVYHTESGDVFTHGNLKSLEQEFAPYGFLRCYDSYLVNVKQIKSLKKDMLTVGGAEIPVSRRKRKDLLRAMCEFMGDK